GWMVASFGGGLQKLTDFCHDLWASASGSSGEPPREKHVAIMVPLWKEHAVIAHMLEHNLAALRYTNYHFFVGAYPNDDPTLDAVVSVANRFPNVHLAMCPHDGPTSKADCLNWIYQHIGLYEEQTGERFDL